MSLVLPLVAYESHIAPTSVNAIGFQSDGSNPAWRCPVLRSFLSMLIMVAGGLIFQSDSPVFGALSFCALPGATVVAGALLVIGLALWLGD